MPSQRFILVVIVLLIAWMFRYEHIGGTMFLDRWTGSVIELPVKDVSTKPDDGR